MLKKIGTSLKHVSEIFPPVFFLVAAKKMQYGRMFLQSPFRFISTSCTPASLFLACLLFLQESSWLCDNSLWISTFQTKCSMSRIFSFPHFSKKNLFLLLFLLTIAPLKSHIEFLMLILS